MSDVTHIRSAIERGDPSAAERRLPLVYEALSKLAARRLAQEQAGQTLQPTALVHEADLRLVGSEKLRDWTGRWHFVAAAAEAMRRILIEAAPPQGEREAGRDRHPLDLVGVDLPAADDGER